jgi:hypothetical protein
MRRSLLPALKQQLRLRAPRPLPHFLVLGTQKGGTTSLHKLLAQHPQVFLPACKEVHYFSLHDQQPLNWYAEHYREARPGQRRGDITPYYLFHPRAPQQIRNVLPNAQLIVLLRDPVERALSQVFHAQRHGFEPLELEAALAAEAERLAGAEERLREPGSTDYGHQKHSYVSRSRYEQQLERFEALFPARQLLVLRSEDLFSATEHSWHRIQAFLGLNVLPLPAPLERANSGRGEADAVPARVRAQLRHQLTGTAETMQQRYGIGWGWR